MSDSSAPKYPSLAEPRPHSGLGRARRQAELVALRARAHQSRGPDTARTHATKHPRTDAPKGSIFLNSHRWTGQPNEAGLSVLRERGYNGVTQPRIAARAGLRQSLFTYYYPTRLDLLEAVGRTAIERQLAAIEATLGGHGSLEAAASAIAAVVVRHENTRVFMALVQAGEEEPRLRELFRELADGIVSRVSSFLGRIGHPGGPTAVEVPARLLHALVVRLAVVDLATGRPDGTQRPAAILEAALHLIAGRTKPSKRRSRSARTAQQQGERS